MAWGKAGSDTLTSAGDTITISSMTASKFNQTLVHNYADATGINPRIRVGTTTIDTGSNYASRYSANGGSDSTEVSQTRIHLSTRDKDEFEVIYSCNISGEEKLFMGSTCNQETAGAGTAPDRTESVGKWVTTSGQYDTIQALNEDSGDYPIGSNISALGSDITPAESIPAIPPLILTLQSPSVGGWVELGRTTLESAGDTITVSGLADKRYYMLLRNNFNSGAVRTGLRLGNGSIDTGNNYANTRSNIGGSDVTNTSTNRIVGDEDGAVIDFNVEYLANLSGKEKLLLRHQVTQETAGAGNVPRRTEMIGKWSNTSNPINTIQSINTESGSFDTNSEIVVLGWDPTDTHTTNFWEELASVNTGAGEVLDSGTFAAKKYLWFQFDIVVDTFNNTNATIRFNSDQNGNYARRLSQNGMATDNTAVGQTHMTFTYSGGKRVFGNYFVINNSSNDKLAIGHTNAIGTAANSTSEGAGVAPRRVEVVGKWANTSSQITQIEVLDTAQGDLGLTSGTIKVWGSD